VVSPDVHRRVGDRGIVGPIARAGVDRGAGIGLEGVALAGLVVATLVNIRARRIRRSTTAHPGTRSAAVPAGSGSHVTRPRAGRSVVDHLRAIVVEVVPDAPAA